LRFQAHRVNQSDRSTELIPLDCGFTQRGAFRREIMSRTISTTDRSRRTHRPRLKTNQKISDLDRRGWMLLDSLGYIQNVNSDTEQLAGRSRDSLLDKPFASLICEEYRRAWLTYFLSHRQAGKKGMLELELNVDRFRRRLSVSTNTTALGGIVEYDITLQEVQITTDQKGPSIDLQFFWDLVRQLPDLVITVDREGLVTFANRSLLQLSTRQIIGRRFSEYLRPCDVQRFTGALRDAFVFGKTANFINEGLVSFPIDSYYSVRITPMPLRSSNKRAKALETAAALIVLTDITDEQRSKHDLRNAAHILQLLGRRVDGVREDERKYLSQELHDQIGQSLTALKIDLWLSRKKLAHPSRPARLAIKRAESAVDKLLEQVRALCSEIRPPELEDFGLAVAMNSYLKGFRKRTAIVCSFESNMDDLLIGTGAALGLFRVFQEAMTNVIRHSHASRTDVSLKAGDKWLTLTVADNGQGFAAEKITEPNSLGLLGMRERTECLGGTLSIQSDNTGSTVIVQVPLVSTPDSMAHSARRTS
jgi:signal transduction histidine kinase